MGGLLQRADARVKLGCLAAYIVVTLHAHTPAALALCLAVALVLAALVRMPVRQAGSVIRPLVPIVVLTAVMQVWYFQQGQVVAQLGPVALTAEGLWSVVRMVASLFSVMLASVAFMRCTDTEELMRVLRWLLAPFRAAGARAEGITLALSVAFRFVPVLVDDFRQVRRAQQARCGSFEGGVRQRLDAYARLIAPLTRSSFRRADTLAQAFVSRCFACGVDPSSLYVSHVGLPDAALAALTVLVVVAALVL